MDKKFVLTGLGYAIVGLALGIFMAASKDHGHLVTHAHIMLVGFVVSFIYGLCHKLWLNNTTTILAKLQYYLHQAGTIGIVVGLFLYYGRFVAMETIDPVLAASSVAVIIGMILMKVLFIQSMKKA
jgi:putative solute:sodium symporter small subunit